MTSLWIKLCWNILRVLLLIMFIITLPIFPSSFSPIALPMLLICTTTTVHGTVARSMMIIACSGHLIPDLEVNHLRIVLVITAPPLQLVAVLVD